MLAHVHLDPDANLATEFGIERESDDQRRHIRCD
jgi:hypothetical protein